MAANDLITLDRAKAGISAIVDTTWDSLLEALITAASGAIQRACRRELVSRTYDELYDGSGDGKLVLRQAPLQEVEFVRGGPAVVLRVVNNNPASIQQARVTVTSTGLKLTHVAAGVATTTTSGLTWAACPTLSALAGAVSGVGSGWSAQVSGDGNDFGGWPSAQLYVAPGVGDGTAMAGLPARGAFAHLVMHVVDLHDFTLDARGWLVRDSDAAWPAGVRNLRVRYVAGFTAIPGDLQQACADLVAHWYWQTKHDPQLVSNFVAGTGTSYALPANLPPTVQGLIAPYRLHRFHLD